MSDHVLVTHRPTEQAGELECHAYGPADRATCQAAGEQIAEGDSPVSFAVLPLEPFHAGRSPGVGVRILP